MDAEFRTRALWWADLVMYGTFFVMQKYLTDVWKMSFTTAATFINIWGGIYRILPIMFLFLADTILGNFMTLALSATFSTTGLVMITVITGLGYGCDKEGEAECIGYTEKALFITAMALIALGRAARFAASKSFIKDQDQTKHEEDQTTNLDDDQMSAKPGKNWSPTSWCSWICDVVGTRSVILLLICFIVFFSMPIAAYFEFPRVKKWYLLFGVSAVCTAFAAVIFFSGIRGYNKPGGRLDGSPITDFLRVLVAALLNISQPSPKPDDLHVTEDEEFKEFSASRFLGFLHKAAIKPGNTAEEAGVGGKKRSWRLCSVSEVESAKILIRMVLVYTTYLMGGVVYSVGNTYVVEQALNMNYNIGHWQPPLQLIPLIFMFGKFLTEKYMHFYLTVARQIHIQDDDMEIFAGGANTTLFSIICCTVSAAVERRRVHAVRRPDLVGQPDDAKVHMGAYWLLFQVLFLGFVTACLHHDLSKFLKEELPRSMKRYRKCLVEGVVGVGFMCGALSVYVVGKFSEMGSSKNWFQHTLNRSRLDRYYWVLAVLATINFFFGIAVALGYTRKSTYVSETKPKKKRTASQWTRRERNMWVNILQD